MILLKGLFWGSLGALAWTHVAYPAAAVTIARLRPRPVRKDPAAEPTVAVIVAAHDEEAVIARRLDNLLALDYPPEKLRIVVASGQRVDVVWAVPTASEALIVGCHIPGHWDRGMQIPVVWVAPAGAPPDG